MVNQPPQYPHGPQPYLHGPQPYLHGPQQTPAWVAQPRPPMPPKKKPLSAWVWIAAIIGGLLVVGMIGSAADGNSGDRAARVTTSAAAPVAVADLSSAPLAKRATTVAPVADIAIPDVVGKNGAIADDILETAGFTKVRYASATPGISLVVMLANWTVVSVEPGAGTVVGSDSVVVLTMTKKNS
ncbi:PASTA domain-containing protein [Nocardia sp. CS682]|uniref:PASTA domain-containing protein n=1 Tax=Nocardia sp. CS682 TaxID=1047172 RepID=UPI0014307B89|nr:PASTA domain-containing protein [Nocardia sp. CS682]